jgi:hypothetical protein
MERGATTRCEAFRAPSAWGELACDQRGAIYAEYLTVLVMVSMVGAAAVVSLGLPVLESFRLMQLLVALPIP